MPTKKPPAYTPSKLVTRPQTVVMGGLALSVVLHAGVGAWAWDKAITERSATVEQPQPVRVKRAAEDYLALELADESYADSSAAEGPTAQEMSQMLLDAPPPALGGAATEKVLGWSQGAASPFFAAWAARSASVKVTWMVIGTATTSQHFSNCFW